MKGLRVCLALYAAAFLWSKDVVHKLSDLAIVRAERLLVAPASQRLIENWPFPLERVISLPRCARPGFQTTYTVLGRRHRYTVLNLPGADCGWRSNGEAGDRGEAYGVVLGDSFTEGAAVSDEETWTARLSELSGRHFLNLGAGAQGLIGHIQRLQSSGVMALHPKLMIVQLSSNDLFEDEWVRRAEDARAGRVRWDLPPLSSAPRGLGRFLGHLWRMAVLRWQGAPPATESQWHLLAANLELLRDAARRADARLLILAEPPYFARLLNRRVPDAMALETNLAKNQRFFYDWHWNAEGHSVVAAQVRDGLVARGWLDLR